MNKKPVIYIDMDGVLVDYENELKDTIRTFSDLNLTTLNPHDELNFLNCKPIQNAIPSFLYLSIMFDVYIASTAPWNNPDAWTQKRLWVEKYLGDFATKRLILTHNKNLLRGNYLIDDRTKNGAGEFFGKHIHFGTDKYPDWKAVIDYFSSNYKHLTGSVSTYTS